MAGYTGGRDVPAARFRVRHFIAPLRACGIDLQEYYPSRSCYPPTGWKGRVAWGVRTVGERVAQVAAGRDADICLLQRELISTVRSLEGLTRRPRVVDIDDAIWLNQRGHAADRLLSSADLAICGNDYLADYAARLGTQVQILPTGVDLRYWAADGPSLPVDGPVLVWSGSSSGLGYLERLEPALCEVLRARGDVRLRVVGDRRPHLPLIDPQRVEFVPWAPADEVMALRGCAIGLMPLPNDAWTRGKCAFKLLTYLSVGLPVVASPVGANAGILKASSGGIAASDANGWVAAVLALVDDEGLATRMGAEGRAFVQRYYSVDVLAPRLAQMLRSVAAG